MEYNILTTEILTNSLMDGFLIVWQICQPVLIPIIVGAIAIGIIKIIARRATQSYCCVVGYSKRETRKIVNRVENVIDLVSTVNDLNDIGKKH